MREIGRVYMIMKNNNKYHGLTLILVIIGLGICLVGGAYAAYNSLAFQRGVVRNRDSEEIRFTSNLLKTIIPSENATSNNYETVLYPFSEQTSENKELSIQLKIANYLLTNEDKISEKDIVFDLIITLSNQQEDGVYTLNGNTIINGSVTVPGVTLKGRKANSVQYNIGFKGIDLNKLTITIEAKPTSASSASLGRRILAANICPCTNSQVNPLSCTGTLLKNSGNPSSYYGYNYEVSISSGKAHVSLSWNSTYFKLDPYFLEKLKNRSGNLDGSLKINGEDYVYNRDSGTIEFIMDQTQAEDDYIITFYPIVEKKAELIEYIKDNWDELNQLLSVNAKEI